jgi:hypothetical protein
MDAVEHPRGSTSAPNSESGGKLAIDRRLEEENEKEDDDRITGIGEDGDPDSDTDGENDGVGGNSSNAPRDDEDDNNDESSHPSREGEEAGTSESGSDAEGRVVTTADGRVLSAYELQREERIRRNREYLQSLGLERPLGDAAGTTMRQQRRSKSKPVMEKQRSSLRAKREVDYSEPKSIASIMRATTSDKEKPTRTNKEARKEPRKEKKESKRMERFVYREFQSIQAHKNQVLRQAEKLHSAARREVKYWSKLVEKAETREKKREEASQNVEDGLSVKALLREVDSRTSELVDAVGRYDNELQVLCLILGMPDFCRVNPLTDLIASLLLYRNTRRLTSKRFSDSKLTTSWRHSTLWRGSLRRLEKTYYFLTRFFWIELLPIHHHLVAAIAQPAKKKH